MRTFIFGLIDIAKEFRGNVLKHIFVTLGLAAAIMTHLVSVGTIQGTVNSKMSYAANNTITVSEVSNNELSDFVMNMDDSKIQNAFAFCYSEKERAFVIGWYGNKPNNWFPLGEGNFLRGEGEAYVSSAVTQFDPTKMQVVEVDGRQFKIVGSTDLWLLNLLMGLPTEMGQEILGKYADVDRFIFLGMSDFWQLEFDQVYLRVQREYPGYFSNSYYEAALTDELREEKKSDLIYPQNISASVWLENMSYFILIGILCIMSYVNMIAVYWHSLDSKARSFQIYILNGAFVKTLRAIIFEKFVILYIISFMCACVMTCALIPVWHKINLSVEYSVLGFAGVFVFGFMGLILMSLRKIHKLSEIDIGKMRYGGGS